VWLVALEGGSPSVLLDGDGSEDFEGAFLDVAVARDGTVYASAFTTRDGELPAIEMIALREGGELESSFVLSGPVLGPGLNGSVALSARDETIFVSAGHELWGAPAGSFEAEGFSLEASTGLSGIGGVAALADGDLLAVEHCLPYGPRPCDDDVSSLALLQAGEFSAGPGDAYPSLLSEVVVVHAACDDGFDNDADGRIDFGHDPGCGSRDDLFEEPEARCDDDFDNDGDGWADYPRDPDCSSPFDDLEATDGDDDGIADADDNCTTEPNADQRDSNQDGFGNLCDPDFNDDGVVGVPDVVFLASSFEREAADPRFDPDTDLDGDGATDDADFEIFRAMMSGPPGPSGLACAQPFHDGSTPCIAEPDVLPTSGATSPRRPPSLPR